MPPQLSFTTNWLIRADTLLSFTASVTDADLPAQLMTFGLDPGAPPAAHIDRASGAFNWMPNAADVGTNRLTVRVTDSGSPSAFATRPLRVVVLPPLQARIGWNGTNISISFDTISGRTYRVEYKDHLTDATWTQLGSNTVANSTSLTFPDNIVANSQRFYRIVQVN